MTAHAGRSARAEYERRLAREKERVHQRRPFVIAFCLVCAIVATALLMSGNSAGWLALAFGASALLGLFEIPQSITAWQTGADGEVRTAAFLQPLEREGFRVLHDRRIPGTRTNIDHIVIGRPGVWVVESKSFSGRLSLRGNEVFVNGRRRTAMLDEALREARAVEHALSVELRAASIQVASIICVHRADLPWFGSRVGDIPIVDGKGLVRSIRQAKPVLSSRAVEHLAAMAEERLRPA